MIIVVKGHGICAGSSSRHINLITQNSLLVHILRPGRNGSRVRYGIVLQHKISAGIATNCRIGNQEIIGSGAGEGRVDCRNGRTGLVLKVLGVVNRRCFLLHNQSRRGRQIGVQLITGGQLEVIQVHGTSRGTLVQLNHKTADISRRFFPNLGFGQHTIHIHADGSRVLTVCQCVDFLHSVPLQGLRLGGLCKNRLPAAISCIDTVIIDEFAKIIANIGRFVEIALVANIGEPCLDTGNGITNIVAQNGRAGGEHGIQLIL